MRCNYVDEEDERPVAEVHLRRVRNDEVKVKYGRTNGEVYAEVAATRLLWALGFGADAMYPVRVTCRGCPRDLQDDGTVTGGGSCSIPAAIERKMKGTELEWDDTVGWSWSELRSRGPTRRRRRSGRSATR